MIEYGFILGLLAVLALFKANKSIRKGFLFLSCISIYLLMVFKAPLTGDYGRYADNFLRSAVRSVQFYWDRGKEAGFYILTKLIGEIYFSTFFYFGVTSAIIILSLFFFINRHAVNKQYAIYFYYTIGLFAFSMAGLRQALAMSFCLFAYEAARKRKLLPFLLIVGAACLLHKSALFFLPAYVIPRIPWKAKYHLAILSAYGLACLFFSRIYALVTDWMNYDYSIESTGNGGIFLFILLIIGFLGIVYRKKLLEADKDNLFYLNMHFAVIFLWIFRMFTRTAERPAFYYLYASIILLDRILSLHQEDEEAERTRKCLVLFSLALFGLFFLYRTLRDGNLVPYVWIFH